MSASPESTNDDHKQAMADEDVANEVEILDSHDEDGAAGQAMNPDDLAQRIAAELQDTASPEVADDALSLLRAECQALKEQLLRERADFDNIRKRLRREAEESGQRAVARFVRPVLVQLDNFSLALEAANPDAFMDFAMGVTMIRDGLLGALADSGIRPVEVEGPFNPAFHEVVAEIPHELPKGHIVSVQRSGYLMAEQLVRAAQVVVSAGAEQAVAEGEPAANDDGTDS